MLFFYYYASGYFCKMSALSLVLNSWNSLEDKILISLMLLNLDLLHYLQALRGFLQYWQVLHIQNDSVVLQGEL